MITKKEKNKKFKITKIFKKASLKFLLIFIAGLFTVPAIAYFAKEIKIGHLAFSFTKNRLSQNEAAQKSQDFIGQTILDGQDVKISDVKDEGNILSFKIEVPDQGTFTSYITKDGRFIFPSGYDLPKIQAEQEKQAQPSPATAIPQSDQPTALLFIMSFCPYGNQAEEGIAPAVSLLKENITVEPHYVIYSDYASGYPDYCLDKENKYCSMHGVSEVNQDVRELCVYKYQPEKYWQFIQQINKDCTAENVDTCWTKSAKTTGVNTNKISQCQKAEAYSLLAKEVDLNKKYNVQGSPDLLINETQYQGGRNPEDYKNALCSAFSSKPEECTTVLGETTNNASGSCN
ncbi:hypothetical protein COT63_00880 [Candidatus Shapirobacteria bacterium CG09_land_8_20_14_0_10_38_17]|uniref:Vacuolar sorting receptor thioredoxin-like domain-containing protein n=1 Tax=Candidatus Shapirobacteria bacterium CG09_land_8_20_14_0_10_38_17 TaxID=1974884 RepID=A0A2H0WRK5_9BACT|nr:MAG: hypothetical protein COT63_00880 [Candidatus Shapirobacteria bacterium CG09_land_8_20_14_0_10_38_17]